MKIILTISLVLYCTGLYAVNSVDLFDQNRGQEKKAEPVIKKTPRQNKSRPKKVNFSLIGISKIGDKYVIHFATVKGKQDSFTWYEHQKSPVTKIYDDYEIDKIINRTLYLNIIKNKSCNENQKQGISCDKKNKQMVMQLVRKKVIASSRPKRSVTKKTKRAATKDREKTPFKWKQKSN